MAIHDTVPIRAGYGYIVIVRIDYNEGEHELYALPLALATGEKAEQVRRESSDLVLADVLHPDGTRGVVFGALWDTEFNNSLLEAVARRRKFRGERGELSAWRTAEFHFALGQPASEPGTVSHLRRAPEYIGRIRRPLRDEDVPALGGRHSLRSGNGAILYG